MSQLKKKKKSTQQVTPQLPLRDPLLARGQRLSRSVGASGLGSMCLPLCWSLGCGLPPVMALASPAPTPLLAWELHASLLGGHFTFPMRSSHMDEAVLPSLQLPSESLTCHTPAKDPIGAWPCQLVHRCKGTAMTSGSLS